MFILSTINCVILFVLSVIHFNWAVGGSWGFANALPTSLEGKRMLNPKKLDSAGVAIGLLSFAIYFLIYRRHHTSGSSKLATFLWNMDNICDISFTCCWRF